MQSVFIHSCFLQFTFIYRSLLPVCTNYLTLSDTGLQLFAFWLIIFCLLVLFVYQLLLFTCFFCHYYPCLLAYRILCILALRVYFLVFSCILSFICLLLYACCLHAVHIYLPMCYCICRTLFACGLFCLLYLRYSVQWTLSVIWCELEICII